MEARLCMYGPYSMPAYGPDYRPFLYYYVSMTEFMCVYVTMIVAVIITVASFHVHGNVLPSAALDTASAIRCAAISLHVSTRHLPV